MADTIVNAPQGDSGAAGWMVAVVILVAVIVGGFLWYRYYGAPQAAPSDTNINVTIPNPLGGTGESQGGAPQTE
jgi:hypothetical protein